MGIYEVTVSTCFSARHSVALPDGTMEPSHEHDWSVTATFRANRLDTDGFVVDFVVVRSALAEITGELEGANLNDLLPPDFAATAECLAEYLAGRLAERMGREVHCVRVTEAAGCSAAFYPNGP
ncbi:MAG: 6-carboxytetrahydropterin synthase [Phycisphaerae bacterium]|nr:6-carboxytetrahydropterin synthase [Phycisphaerae bacterium]